MSASFFLVKNLPKVSVNLANRAHCTLVMEFQLLNVPQKDSIQNLLVRKLSRGWEEGSLMLNGKDIFSDTFWKPSYR